MRPKPLMPTLIAILPPEIERALLGGPALKEKQKIVTPGR
jgi:hypothetical protein